MDGAQTQPRKRATSQAKSTRLWKRTSSMSDLNIKEESNKSIMDASDYQSEPDSNSAGGEATTFTYSTFPATVSGAQDEDDQDLDQDTIHGWIQRIICLVGNVNTALASERLKSILLEIEPKLVNLTLNEPGAQAKWLLFGDSFVKEFWSFIQMFFGFG
ncbi:Hypothetical predicted protein [Pelobates cultripes]|uniref:Uncharacterized protein n=1 Tax=Pelobates cultripes TaxID=61616 RepID=A0AAD1WJD2_PELCU|nr:Hypothetical predicted protein [Pelobates cultripes]